MTNYYRHIEPEDNSPKNAIEISTSGSPKQTLAEKEICECGHNKSQHRMEGYWQLRYGCKFIYCKCTKFKRRKGVIKNDSKSKS